MSAESRVAVLLIDKANRHPGWRWKALFGEIDIVACRRDRVVFVKVKTPEQFDAAAEAVSERSQRSVARAAP